MNYFLFDERKHLNDLRFFVLPLIGINNPNPNGLNQVPKQKKIIMNHIKNKKKCLAYFTIVFVEKHDKTSESRINNDFQVEMIDSYHEQHLLLPCAPL